MYTSNYPLNWVGQLAIHTKQGLCTSRLHDTVLEEHRVPSKDHFLLQMPVSFL